jgi:hypothetical protein
MHSDGAFSAGPRTMPSAEAQWAERHEAQWTVHSGGAVCAVSTDNAGA